MKNGKDSSINALVLLPGLEGTGLLFADLVSRLPTTLNITIARFPTERFLSYPELIQFVQEMFPKTGRFVIVAESFSTPLAVMLAAFRPPNLTGLVLCAGFIRSPIGNLSFLARPLVHPLLFRFPPPSFMLKFFATGFNPPAGLEARVRAANQQVDPAVIAKRVRAVLDCDVRNELARTEIPLLYIQGEKDHLVWRRCFYEIRRVRPDARLESIPAPHLVLQREPKIAAEIILRFMESMTLTAK